MANQSKNDQNIRNLLLKTGTLHQVPNTYTRKDPKASMMAAINARKAEFRGTTSR